MFQFNQIVKHLLQLLLYIEYTHSHIRSLTTTSALVIRAVQQTSHDSPNETATIMHHSVTETVVIQTVQSLRSAVKVLLADYPIISEWF